MEEMNRVSASIVDSAIAIHRELGPGLLESVYQRVLAPDLTDRGHDVRQQVPVSFRFRGLHFRNAFRMDLVVDNVVVVEVKSVETLTPVYFKQVLTYVRLADFRLGLLLNFGAPLMKNGIHRIINSGAQRFPPSDRSGT